MDFFVVSFFVDGIKTGNDIIIACENILSTERFARERETLQLIKGHASQKGSTVCSTKQDGRLLNDRDILQMHLENIAVISSSWLLRIK